MSSRRGTYGAALRVTLRNTASAYGYTLATATTIHVLTDVGGKADPLKLFLFAVGGVVAFVLLEAILFGLKAPAPRQPLEHAVPFAGALHAASVCVALGAAILIAHLVRSALAWFLAQMATTAIYMLVVAVEIAVAAAIERRASDARKSSAG
jgi:hypothetical protein